MKANRSATSGRTTRAVRLACVLFLASLVTACSAPPSPMPTPPTSPPRAAVPAPRAPPAIAPTDWLDAPITPGTWTWSEESGASVARFGGGKLVLRCDRASATVSMELASAQAEPGLTTIQTESLRRVVTAAPQVSGGNSTLVVRIPARDAILDAMAFSRGRFAVLTAHEPALYVPSWPEVSRVIEDCR